MAFGSAICILIFVMVSSCSCLQLELYADLEQKHPPPWKYCTLPGCAPVGEDKESEFVDESDTRLSDQWAHTNHCRLRYAFDSVGKRNVSFTVIGGSATAGAGLKEGQSNWFQHLQSLFSARPNGSQATFNNAAQGATESFWGAAMMDSVVGDADVLFWEYAINDVKGHTTGYPKESAESMRQGIEFFIRKSLQLPSKPAIVFVYLYDAASHYDTFHSTALLEQNPVLKQFAEAAVDILVVPVSETLRGTHAKDEMNEHHPGPRAHAAIAKLVFDAMTQAADATHHACSPEEYKAAAHEAAVPEGSDVAKEPMLRMLHRMGSISDTPIEPRFGEPRFITEACVSDEGGPGHWDHCSEVVKDTFGKGEPGRADRKIGYDIPPCVLRLQLDGVKIEKHHVLRVTLDGAPSDVVGGMIGMHIGGGGYAANAWSHGTRVSIDNEQPKTFMPSSSSPFGVVFNVWITIEARRKSSQAIVLELCMPEENATGNWNASNWSPFHNGGGRLDWISAFTEEA